MSEPFVTDRTVGAVGAGCDYPYAQIGTGTAGVAAIAEMGSEGDADRRGDRA